MNLWILFFIFFSFISLSIANRDTLEDFNFLSNVVEDATLNDNSRSRRETYFNRARPICPKGTFRTKDNKCRRLVGVNQEKS